MKITPLDIRRKEFRRAVRGYSDEEVDIFLDEVADEFERLFQENIDLQDRVHRLDEQAAGYTQVKEALEKTLITAQLQSEEMRSNAHKESELILRDAQFKARGIVNESYSETQRVQQALVQLKLLEEDFRFKFRLLLEGYLNLLGEAPISAASEAAAAETPARLAESRGKALRTAEEAAPKPAEGDRRVVTAAAPVARPVTAFDPAAPAGPGPATPPPAVAPVPPTPPVAPAPPAPAAPPVAPVPPAEPGPVASSTPLPVQGSVPETVAERVSPTPPMWPVVPMASPAASPPSSLAGPLSPPAASPLAPPAASPPASPIGVPAASPVGAPAAEAPAPVPSPTVAAAAPAEDDIPTEETTHETDLAIADLDFTGDIVTAGEPVVAPLVDPEDAGLWEEVEQTLEEDRSVETDEFETEDRSEETEGLRDEDHSDESIGLEQWAPAPAPFTDLAGAVPAPAAAPAPAISPAPAAVPAVAPAAAPAGPEAAGVSDEDVTLETDLSLRQPAVPTAEEQKGPAQGFFFGRPFDDIDDTFPPDEVFKQDTTRDFEW